MTFDWICDAFYFLFLFHLMLGLCYSARMMIFFVILPQKVYDNSIYHTFFGMI